MLVYRKIIQSGGLATVLCLGAVTGTLFAQAGAPSPSPSVGASATPAVQAASQAPTPTLEQRVAGLEAYLMNGDPSLSLKDKDGNIPKDLTTVSVGTSGPGHNAWMMTSSALVLFMTLPGLALFYGGLVR